MNKPPLVNRMLTVCRTMMHGEPILFVQGTLAEHRGNAAINHYIKTYNKDDIGDKSCAWRITSITKEGKCSIRNEYIETTLVDIDVNEII